MLQVYQCDASNKPCPLDKAGRTAQLEAVSASLLACPPVCREADQPQLLERQNTTTTEKLHPQ